MHVPVDITKVVKSEAGPGLLVPGSFLFLPHLPAYVIVTLVGSVHCVLNWESQINMKISSLGQHCPVKRPVVMETFCGCTMPYGSFHIVQSRSGCLPSWVARLGSRICWEGKDSTMLYFKGQFRGLKELDKRRWSSPLPNEGNYSWKQDYILILI